MFNIGGGEVLVIALIALIVLGPERLPDAARTVGKVMGEIRRLSTGFQDEVRTAFSDVDTPPGSSPRPPSSPLAAEVAELDEGRIDAATDTPLRAIEATATDAGPVPSGAPTEVSADVADALGEILGRPGPGEHRAAS
jgi:sec-independent protein translocase protein TatB